PNLFYGTGIPACIIVLDKENAPGRTGIFMIDASKGFTKDGNKNRLRHQDIRKIVDVFTGQIELPKYSRMVPLSEIGDPKNDYNLNIPRYIDSTEEEDLQDIEGHLLGGIPNHDLEGLHAYWEVFPSLRAELFAPAARPGYSRMNVDAAQVKAAIFEHAEFKAYHTRMSSLFEAWKQKIHPLLTGLEAGAHPKALIAALGEELLVAFSDAALIDKYDVYQHLMAYWTETLQDDAYMIAGDGWTANSDLIPEPLLIRRYFSADQADIERLQAEQEALAAQLDALSEEHGGEGGLLEEAKNDKGKITKGSVKARMKEIEGDDEAQDERELLTTCLALIEQESAANKKVKDAQKALAEKVTAKYKQLSLDEVKALVVDDKWLAALAADIQTELDRVSQALTGRIKELAERYATPMPELVQDVGTLTDKVDMHLKKMGFVWN
ncbi:MAG: N-6 DNA methylase, partial [Anaerolineales bacterium]|nr:N-6 DNA methylase [Anaerolineales bacterium]